MDFLHDTNLAELSEIANMYVIPDFVKSEAVPEKTASAELPETAFAWPAEKLFPVTSKAHTWLSVAYLDKHASNIGKDEKEHILDNLAVSMKFWGITTDDFQTMMHKKASETTKGFPLHYRFCGSTHATVHVNSAEEIDKVASSLVESRTEMPWLMRADVALQALNAASSIGCDLQDSTKQSLQKTAGFCIASSKKLTQDLLYREALYANHGREDLVEKVASLRSEYANKESILPLEFQKIASVLDSLDRFVSLHGTYSPAFAAPEDIGHAVPLCTMQSAHNDIVKLADGSQVSRRKLMDKSLSLRFALGKVASKKIEDVDIITTLQALPAVVSQEVLKQVGI